MGFYSAPKSNCNLTISWKIGDYTIPCYFDRYNISVKAYSLFFNITLEPDSFLKNPMTPAPVDTSLLRLKISIDNGLLKYFKGKGAPEIDVTFSNYPMPFDRFLNGFNIISLAGTLFFFFIPMVTFIIILIKITKEKELRIRHVTFK